MNRENNELGTDGFASDDPQGDAQQAGEVVAEAAERSDRR